MNCLTGIIFLGGKIMKNFLKELSALENQIITDGYYNYSDNTRQTLLDVIDYVEKASFTTSVHSKFICSNFRCNSKQLQYRWNNREGIDDEKSEEAFRSQISTVSKQLFSIFGSDFVNVFLMEDTRGLSLISDLLDALTGYPDNVNDYLVKEVVEEVEDVIWVKSYYTEELLPIIEALRPFLKKNIWQKLEELDHNKLSYLLHVLSLPTTSNKTRKTNTQKIEILQELNKKPIKNIQNDTKTKKDIIDLFREEAERENDYPESEENRNYLRKVITYAKNNIYISEMCKARKFSNKDIELVLNELNIRN